MPDKANRESDPALRVRLRAAAFELLDAEGPGRLSVRAAARRIEVAPTSAARVYESREKLLTDMAGAALRDLAAALGAALAVAPAARLARLRAAGAAAQAFAERTPHRYALCWRVKDIDASEADWLAASEAVCDRLRGVLDMGDPTVSHLAAGSLLHGYVQLSKSGALGPA